MSEEQQSKIEDAISFFLTTAGIWFIVYLIFHV